jgi:hypothetical protein
MKWNETGVAVKKISLVFFAVLSMAVQAAAKDQVGEIAPGDTEKIARRFESRQFRYFAIAPAKIDQADNRNLAHRLAFGYIWDSAAQASVKAIGEGVFTLEKPQALVGNFSIGANFYLSPSAIAPFLGADFGYGALLTRSDNAANASGFSIGGVAGMALFRTSGIQLQVELRKAIIFPEKGSQRPGFSSIGIVLLF